MTLNNAKALLAKIQSDPKLSDELKQSKSEADFLEKAKKHGYEVTIAEFRKALEELSETKKGELSEKELEKVAGGLTFVGIDYAFVSIQTAKH
ncbi:MAG: Nif11-like leader peptide family RiPP precursor [Candidatus Wallbacteria bacterium]